MVGKHPSHQENTRRKEANVSHSSGRMEGPPACDYSEEKVGVKLTDSPNRDGKDRSEIVAREK